jgi:hypothetical protein
MHTQTYIQIFPADAPSTSTDAINPSKHEPTDQYLTVTATATSEATDVGPSAGTKRKLQYQARSDVQKRVHTSNDVNSNHFEHFEWSNEGQNNMLASMSCHHAHSMVMLPQNSSTLPHQGSTLPPNYNTLPRYVGTLPHYSVTLPHHSTTLPPNYNTLPLSCNTTLPQNSIPSSLHGTTQVQNSMSSQLYGTMSMQSDTYTTFTNMCIQNNTTMLSHTGTVFPHNYSHARLYTSTNIPHTHHASSSSMPHTSYQSMAAQNPQNTSYISPQAAYTPLYSHSQQQSISPYITQQALVTPMPSSDSDSDTQTPFTKTVYLRIVEQNNKKATQNAIEQSQSESAANFQASAQFSRQFYGVQNNSQYINPTSAQSFSQFYGGQNHSQYINSSHAYEPSDNQTALHTQNVSLDLSSHPHSNDNAHAQQQEQFKNSDSDGFYHHQDTPSARDYHHGGAVNEAVSPEELARVVGYHSSSAMNEATSLDERARVVQTLQDLLATVKIKAFFRSIRLVTQTPDESIPRPGAKTKAKTSSSDAMEETSANMGNSEASNECAEAQKVDGDESIIACVSQNGPSKECAAAEEVKDDKSSNDYTSQTAASKTSATSVVTEEKSNESSNSCKSQSSSRTNDTSNADTPQCVPMISARTTSLHKGQSLSGTHHTGVQSPMADTPQCAPIISVRTTSLFAIPSVIPGNDPVNFTFMFKALGEDDWEMDLGCSPGDVTKGEGFFVFGVRGGANESAYETSEGEFARVMHHLGLPGVRYSACLVDVVVFVFVWFYRL